MKAANETTTLIVRDVLEEGPGELSSKNPTVLSCGGIYIPHRRMSPDDRPIWEILNVADETRPIKVVGSRLPISPLALILQKESMN